MTPSQQAVAGGTASPPRHAQVVVIGAGVVGASVAYHLGELGCRDVVLLERAKIGCGTTWHAAGNMETYRTDPVIGEMVRYAVEFFPRLEAETGQALGWRQTGRVMFTHLPERMVQYRGLPALGRARGIEIELLTPCQVAEKLPIVSEKGLVGGAWIPSDGRVNPTDLAVALTKGAKQRGVRIFENTPVLGMSTRDGRISAVATPAGEIRCETVVIAAGLWSPLLGAMLGVRVPLHAVQHLYLLTKPIDIVSRDMPLFISYDERLYGREDVGGLLVGFFDSNAIPIGPAELPKDFSFGLLDSNWDQVEPNMAVALERFPVLQRAEVRTLLNGPESFTPDMQMLLGEMPTVRGCFLATGMNSSGIALSACTGRLTAEWIVNGRPSLDASRLDIRRFADCQSIPAYLRDRASEVVTHMCRLPVPDLDFVNTRMIRRSPVHDALAVRGARFVSVLAWERPLWFTTGKESTDGTSPTEAEVVAAETSVVLFDRSSDFKLQVEGARAGALLRKLSGALSKVPIGAALRAPMLNAWGGVETLPTVVRLGDESWLLLCEPEQSTRLAAWIDRHWLAAGVIRTDVTSAWAAFLLAGPRALKLLDRLCGKLPETGAAMHDVELDYAPGRLISWPGADIHYLMTPTEFAVGVHDRLVAEGQSLGLRHAGSLAAEVLAIGQQLRRFGSEANPMISVVAAGLDGGLDLEANRRFIGRASVVHERRRPPVRQIRAFTLRCDAPVALLNAPVMWNGQPAGYVTSGAIRLPQGKAILLALVELKDDDMQYVVVIDGQLLTLHPSTALGDAKALVAGV